MNQKLKDKLRKDKTNKVILLLVLSTIVIWGVVIYKVIDYLNSSGTNESEIIKQEESVDPGLLNRGEKNSLDTISFTELERNPFIFVERQKITATKQKNNLPKRIVPPIKKQKINYAINGVIINEKHKLVIFEDLTNNKTLFLKEGEVYNEITVKEIGKTKVSIVEADGVKEVSLQ